MKRILILAIAITLPLSLYSFSGVSADDKKEDIEKLIELNDINKIADEFSAVTVNQMITILQNSGEELPDGYYVFVREEITKIFREQMNIFMERTIPIFDKHYSHEDIKGLIVFYESPLGKKVVEKQPVILAEVYQATQEWSQELAPIISERLQKQLEKEMKTK